MDADSVLKNKKSAVIFYASYMPIFPVRSTTQETERDRIRFLLDSGFEHVIAQSSISNTDEAPVHFSERMIMPSHKFIPAKSSMFKIIDRIYFNLFLIKSARYLKKRKRNVILFFYGQDLIPAGNI